MLTVTVLAVVLSQGPVTAEAKADVSAAVDPELARYDQVSIKDQEARSFQDINEDIHKTLRAEALSKKQSDRAAAIVKLTVLHRELLLHPNFEESDTLKEYRIKVWARLTKVKKSLKAQIARDARNKKQSYDDQVAEYSDRYAANGQGADVAGSAGGQAVADHGPALVDLIERTINPEFWDVNGGPGSIYYFRPLHALVVRATAESHENLGDVLQQLRRAQ